MVHHRRSSVIERAGDLLSSRFNDPNMPGGGVCRTARCYSYRTGGGHLCAMHELLFIAEFGIKSTDCDRFGHNPYWHWRP